jgi:hypothetical protein
MEMGTDSWINIGSNEQGYLLYNSSLNTSTGSLKTIWQALYSTVNFCNTALYYAPYVRAEYGEKECDAKVAEAYFLRAWANFHVVEQFGGVVLRTKPFSEDADVAPVRSSEKEFYDLIITDLQFACVNLPISQAERGRATKKAAYGMLAKACLQRTRLGEKEKYAKMALDAAEELIKNPDKYECELYTSDATKSGFTKLWDGDNNKNNKEFLFLEAIDHINGLNPETWNRGRTRQYYEADIRTVGAEWGMTERSPVYGRANTRFFKPTKYLLTQIFDPLENTPDTRFENTFYYKYYACNDKEITMEMAQRYEKDQSLVGKKIKSSALRGNSEKVKATNYYCSVGNNTVLWEGFENTTIDANGESSLAILTPNWTVTGKNLMPYLVNDPSDMFKEDGSWTENVQRKEIYPSMKKFSCLRYCYSEQYHTGDVPILRLGDVYLIAAEAALLYNDDKMTAAKYVNEIRKRAAITEREGEIQVNDTEITLEFILKERARELAGEQYRWYDLKRMGKLTKEYLLSTNPEITEFDISKHLVRPIPVSFLNSIANADEFGTNGY